MTQNGSAFAPPAGKTVDLTDIRRYNEINSTARAAARRIAGAPAKGGETSMRSNMAAPWRVIYIARGEKQARQIEDLLLGAGFMMDRASPDGADARSEDIEIKVLESEAKEARMFLMEQGL